jgi:biotin transport system substrate-specific component
LHFFRGVLNKNPLILHSLLKRKIFKIQKNFKFMGEAYMVFYRKSLKVETLSKKEWMLASIQIALGSLLLATLSVFKVPLYPTPMTLQTLGVFLLPLMLGPKKAMAAVGLYLIEASCGWPILSGGTANPLWIMTPNFGFLLSFPLSAFVIGVVIKRFSKPHFYTTILTLFFGQLLIICGGVLGLSCFFGLEKAWAYGVTPFIGSMLAKIFLAATCYHGGLHIKNRKNKG